MTPHIFLLVAGIIFLALAVPWGGVGTGRTGFGWWSFHPGWLGATLIAIAVFLVTG